MLSFLFCFRLISSRLHIQKGPASPVIQTTLVSAQRLDREDALSGGQVSDFPFLLDAWPLSRLKYAERAGQVSADLLCM